MPYTIRPAEQTDAPFIAWIMLEASRSGLPRGFWDIFLNQEESKVLEFLTQLAQTPTLSICHYSRFLLAIDEKGNPAAGMACTYGKDGYGEVFQRAFGETVKHFGWTDEQLKNAWERVKSHFECYPPAEPENWIIEWVACKLEHRKKGLVDRLLEACMEKGEKKEAKTFQICVAIGNTPAQNAYAKKGFMTEIEKKTPAYEKTFGHPGLAKLILKKLRESKRCPS